MPASAANLFHPKKPILKKENGQSSTIPVQTVKPRSSLSTSLKKDQSDNDNNKPLHPQLPFKEYKLLSTEQSYWKYDIMKFDSRRPVDITSWSTPVKLNRKELRRETSENGLVLGAPKAVGPMLGPDGKPVIGADGRIVQIDAEGRPIPSSSSLQSAGSSRGSTPNVTIKEKVKSKKFQKKTRQVFLVPEETRKMRREERHPWLLEDATGKEVWVGMMDDASKKDSYAILMPSTDNTFKFIATHRWYKFQKKAPLLVSTLEEVEKIMARRQKNKDPERWLLRRTGQAPSASTSAVFRAEAEGRTIVGSDNSLVHSASQSLGPGGRRLKTVDSGMRGLFEEDDEEGVDVKRRREKERGADGDFDELEFEETFADDEEKMEPEGAAEDEEAKEAEERLKREYKSANKTREGYIDEDDSEDEGQHLTGAGKAMKKLVRNHDKSGTYESDEEKNPYASTEEEEEEEEIISTVSATQQQQAEMSTSRNGSQPPSNHTTPKPSTPSQRGQSPSLSASRANSPTPIGVSSLGGHFVVAKRATSPKAPKLKVGGGSRASSPLAQSPLSRTGSLPPVSIPNGTGQSTSRASSPMASTSPTSPSQVNATAAAKRKADESAVNRSQQPKAKKRKAGAQASPGELRDEMLVEWLKNTPDATTRDCIHYFQPCLTDESLKARFTEMVKRIAFVKQGTMVLRNNYRDGSPQAQTSTAMYPATA